MNRRSNPHPALSAILKFAAILAIASAEALAEEKSEKTLPATNPPAEKSIAEKPTQPARIGRRIIVSIPDRKLVLLDGHRIVKVYDVAVGKSSTPSPRGSFRVVNRVPNPTWYGPRKVVAPGKQNPLGTRWIGLSASGYGIHGTNAPASIGKPASHGCVRMRKHDIEELFDLVEVGVPVELSAERPPVVAMLLALESAE